MNRLLMRIAAILFLFSIAGLNASNGGSQTKENEGSEKQTFKVKTELMEVRAVVTDGENRIIENLRRDDFELLEND